MEAFDVIEHVGASVDQCQIATAMDALTLELAEEAFGCCVVTAMTDVAHAADDAVVSSPAQ